MDSLQIEIINPKAAKLLQDLADLNLTTIKKRSSKTGFAHVLKKLRAKSSAAPTPEEIAKEIEIVRGKRYGK